MREQHDADAMSAQELEAYLADAAHERERRRAKLPSDHQRNGGANIEYSLLLLVCSLGGMIASGALLMAERTLLRNPSSALICDINPLIGCSRFLTSSVNEVLLGMPNALYGFAFFSGLTALALALLSGARFARWMWALLNVGMVAGAIWLMWFQYTAMMVERSLCPYCIVTWIVTIPVIVFTWIHSAWSFLPLPDKPRRILVRSRWLIVLGIYAILIAIVVINFWNMWAFVF